MGTLRDSLLPVVGGLRRLPADFGLNRYTVTIRTRTWPGDVAEDGVVPTDSDLVISPTPTVKLMSPYAAQMSGIATPAGSIEDRYFKITDITPQYTDPATGLTGGYTPDQISPKSFDPHVETLVVLVGDNGRELECSIVLQQFDDPFGYELTVQERRHLSYNPLLSLVVAPSPAAVHVAAKVQFTATGTYKDGMSADLTALVVWASSDQTKAKFTTTAGQASGVAPGTANVTATYGTVVSPAVVLTVS